MIKKILVVPRTFAITISQKTNMQKLAIISICTEKKDILFTNIIKKQMNCQNILTLIFADLTTTDYKIAPHLTSKFTCFNIQMAQQTITFLNTLKNKDIKLLLIHCDAGVSRSGAIGIFAIRYLKMDENIFKKEHLNIGPNTLVYDTLSKVSGLNNNYQKWWENMPNDNSKLIF